MRTIPIADIITPPERQRRHFDEDLLNELATDIQENDLLHPIVLRSDARTLVAGERRLRAIGTYIFPLGGSFRHDGEDIPAGHIPYTVCSDSDALGLMAKEFAENSRRADLTWQEVAETQAALHALRVAQAAHETEILGSSALSVTHSIRDTAMEIHGRADGSYHTDTRNNLILAEHLDNPEVAKAKTAKDAMKVLLKQEEGRRHSALATLIGKTYSASQHEAYQVDCITYMMAETKDSETGVRFDVILTDPPYGMGADKFGDAAGKLLGTEHHYDDSYEAWWELMTGLRRVEGSMIQLHRGWCQLAFDICKSQAHAYVFCDFDRFHELKSYMQNAGWYVFRTPIVNIKESGRVPLPEEGPRRQYEICLYAIKGHKHTTAIYPDVINSSADEQMGHGAQKPVSLYVDLLRRSTRPGDLVLDAFSGSGTIFPAATECKVRAVGLEKEASSYGMGLARLQALIAAESAQPTLPGVE